MNAITVQFDANALADELPQIPPNAPDSGVHVNGYESPTEGPDYDEVFHLLLRYLRECWDGGNTFDAFYQQVAEIWRETRTARVEGE